MSEDLYPTRYKKNNKLTYITCKLCGTEVPEDQCKNGICKACLKIGDTYRCSKCGNEIVYTNYQKYIKQSKKYELCHDCYELSQKVKVTVRCSDCGKSFDITNSQYDFYVKKGLDIPKRCKACRDAKKSGGRSQQANTYTKPESYSGSASSSSGSHGSFCFITTAVCEYYGKPDDCYELTTLRNYRDNWLRNQPDGAELIAEYYKTAPLIVSKMKASSSYSKYCEKLWNEYIIPCLNFIRHKQYNECKQLYSKMFYYMKNEVAN